jgi:hypothetical protein
MYTLFVVDVDYAGKIWDIIAILLIVTIASVSIGIFISTFAKTNSRSCSSYRCLSPHRSSSLE